MNSALTLVRQRLAAKQGTHTQRRHCGCIATAAFVVSMVATPAHALDGCLVLLCLAAPSWRAVPGCVPPIQQLFRDLARGRAFPSCGMAGPGNSSHHDWARAPQFCPPQYTQILDGDNSREYRCDYSGAVSVEIDGALWTQTWWSMDGDTVTSYTPAARARLGTWDTRFDDDYARWLAIQPLPTP